MLKVVGASAVKTRLTTVMLIAVIIIAVFAIFFYEVPLQENDGYYSASVTWSKTTGFREIYWGQNNDPNTVQRGVARVYYKPDMTTTGWSTLEIQTNPAYPDWVQAFAAGLLEGSICWQLIYWHWENTIAKPCEQRKEFCNKVRKQLEINSKIARKNATENDAVSPYWHQVNLFYTQLDGMETGWRNGVVRSRKDKVNNIPKIDFLLMNSGSDFKDLEYQYNASRKVERTKPFSSLTFLKYAPNSTDQFLLAHEAAGFYSEMLRLHKRYDFGYHMTSSKLSPLTPGQKMIFTSYPATLYSRDDFYQISGQNSHMTVAGVAITNYNRSLWNETEFLEKILIGPRAVASNRIARNGHEWANEINYMHSGTGNKHWLVISGSDKHKKGKNFDPLTLWIIEQVPGFTAAHNVTDMWKRQGYWVNVGIPYDQKIKMLSGYNSTDYPEAMYKMELLSPIHKILVEKCTEVKDKETLISLMRRPELAAAGRSDVVFVNVTNSDGSGDIPKVVGDNGFSVHYDYKGALNNSKGSGHYTNQIHHGFHDNMKGMIDEKGPKDRVRTLENNKLSKGKLDEDYQSREKLITEYVGIIDLKVSEGYSKYTALAGPPFNPTYRIEPFRWSTSLLKHVPHYGQVDLWDFNPVQPQWVW